jgi:alkaline phosphatase D
MRLTFLLLCLCGLARGVHAQAEVQRIMFGSCIRQERPTPVLDRAVEAAPDVFLFLGDNIYGDTQDMSVLRDKYARLGANDAVSKLLGSTRVMAVWDDHDFGENDAGADYPMREQSKQIMLDFFREPADSPRRQREGNYDSVIIGREGRRVQFLLLDTRWFRSPLALDETEAPRKRYRPTTQPDATLLGETQWQWLESQLREPAEVRIVASSIQVLSTQHKFEKWANFPRDLERLLKLLGDASGEIVIVSGDRHFAELMQTRIGDKQIREVTSSSVNASGRGNVNEPNDNRIDGTSIGVNNVGQIDIDWATGDIAISLIGEDGAAIVRR